MAISTSFNRRIRPRAEEEDDYESTSPAEESTSRQGSGEDSPSESGSEDIGSSSESDEDDDNDDDDEEEEATHDKGSIQSALNQISFGSLAKAQASLGKRKRSESSTKKESALSIVEDIRAKLREAREQKRGEAGTRSKNDNVSSSTTTTRPSRSSKHAPTIQSSKHAVTRKRTVVDLTTAVKPRDPRFDPAVLSHSSSGGGGAPRDPAAVNRAYAFLDDYRSAELKELKEQMARTKDPRQKEELKRAITSAADRQRALDNRKREHQVLAEHKKRERDLIREGKKSQPYYLKKSDVKRETLVKKYESMGSKERARALERRRKKVAGKEKKDLPWGRRALDE